MVLVLVALGRLAMERSMAVVRQDRRRHGWMMTAHSAAGSQQVKRKSLAQHAEAGCRRTRRRLAKTSIERVVFKPLVPYRVRLRAREAGRLFMGGGSVTVYVVVFTTK